jgi:hypothetical protein
MLGVRTLSPQRFTRQAMSHPNALTTATMVRGVSVVATMVRGASVLLAHPPYARFVAPREQTPIRALYGANRNSPGRG